VWTFRHANNKCAVIRLHFLQHYTSTRNLMIKSHSSKLIFADDVKVTSSVKNNVSKSKLDEAQEFEVVKSFVPSAQPAESLNELFENMLDVFDLDNFLKPSKVGVKHHIKTNGVPVKVVEIMLF